MANYKAKKAGMALHKQKELEHRYDDEEKLGIPEHILQWMNTVLEGEHPAGYGSSWRKLHFHMRDGTALCKLLNKLRVAAGMAPLKYQKNALTQFVALENIKLFNIGVREYGVEEESLFQAPDLYEAVKGSFLHVVICLKQLGFLANAKGFTPRFEGVEANDVQST